MSAEAFARTVIAAFAERGLTSDAKVKEAGGPSDTYMTGLRKAATDGEPLRPLRSDTARRIDAAAAWKPGTALELWRTGALPPRATSRAAAPNTTASIHTVNAYVKREEDRGQLAVVTSHASIPGGESTLEVRYHPGPGRAITASDLVGLLGGLHRAALGATYLDPESAASVVLSDHAATTGPDNFALAADDTAEKHAEQEADPYP